VSDSKNNISQIRRYLNGELDARAMHKLEREALDDPFLMDALDGYGTSAKDQSVNLDELKDRLNKRITPAKQRSIVLWRVLPIAASLLIALTIGYLFLLPSQNPEHYKQVSKAAPKALPPVSAPANPPAEADQLVSVPKHIQPTVIQRKKADTSRSALSALIAAVAVPDNQKDKSVLKQDTAEYKASAYPVNANVTANDLLKKLPGVDVDASGNVTSQGKQITKVRINGKDFFGSDVRTATKNLPADIVEKIQVIDDYGDQALRMGIPNKVINIEADTANTNKLVVLNNLAAARAKSIGANDDHSLREVAIRGTGSVTAKQQPAMSMANIGPKTVDTSLFVRKPSFKQEKTQPDSVSSLAEVVVEGHPDKAGPQPLNGWKSYIAYIKQRAFMTDGSIGKVKLAFKVDTKGSVYDIRVIRGSNLAINNRAIEIIKSGPGFIGAKTSKEFKLKIKFYKKA
jgi:hypothetical protein